MAFEVDSLRDDYVAASGTDYSFTFPIFSKNDITVLKNGTEQVIDVDCTVRNGAAAFETLPTSSLPATGFVRFTIAPTAGDAIVLIPKQALKQSSMYTSIDFHPKRLESDFDKAAFLVRGVLEKLRRTVKFALKSLQQDLEIDEPVPNGFWKWDPSGQKVIYVSGVANIGEIEIPVSPSLGGTGAVLSPIKGDLLIGKADGTLMIVPVGADDETLVADSTTPSGVRWVAQEEIQLIPPGVFVPYGGAVAPTGWLLCDGSAVSRTTFASLFNVIGTAYGVGDGSTTFNLPGKGRVFVGKDDTQTEFDTLGEVGGAKTHTLTIAQMPVHRHSLNMVNTTPLAATGGNPVIQATGALETGDAGSGEAHNNLQPYQVANYIIKT